MNSCEFIAFPPEIKTQSWVTWLNAADAQELHLHSQLFFATAMDAGCIYLWVKALVVAAVGTGNVLLVFPGQFP